MSYRPILNINLTNDSGKSITLKSYRVVNRLTALILLLKLVNMKEDIIRVKFVLEENPTHPRYGMIKRINVIVTEDFDLTYFAESEIEIPKVIIHRDFKGLHDISFDHKIIRKLKCIFTMTDDNPMKHNYLTKSN